MKLPQQLQAQLQMRAPGARAFARFRGPLPSVGELLLRARCFIVADFCEAAESVGHKAYFINPVLAAFS